jgi:hypothetical protein
LITYNIYSLRNIWDRSPIYDAYDGFIVAASSEKDARILANERPGDEGPIWTDPTKVSCEHIGFTLPSDIPVGYIISSDFHAG